MKVTRSACFGMCEMCRVMFRLVRAISGLSRSCRMPERRFVECGRSDRHVMSRHVFGLNKARGAIQWRSGCV